LTLGTSSAAETFLAPAVAEGVLDFNGTFLTSLEAVFEAKGFLAAAGEALAVLAAEAAVGLLKADEREAVVDVVDRDAVDVVVLAVVVLLVVVVGFVVAVPFLNAVLLVVDGPVVVVGAVRLLTGEAVLAVVVDRTAPTFLSAAAVGAGLVVVVRAAVGLAVV